MLAYVAPWAARDRLQKNLSKQILDICLSGKQNIYVNEHVYKKTYHYSLEVEGESYDNPLL
jgi:hypothetical protein